MPALTFPRLLAVSLLLLALLPGKAPASELTQYKDLRNDFIKVTDVKERERTEERYLDTGGKVTLQKVPYKEVVVTAELRQKPPSTMATVFNANAEPYFKICMELFDTAGTRLEDDCQVLHFQSLVKGNVGTAAYKLPENAVRYSFRVPQKLPNKDGSFKLWTPN